MQNLLQDLRYAVRTLLQSPVFAFVAVPVVLVLVPVIAVLIPARRATRVDPVVVLRA